MATYGDDLWLTAESCILKINLMNGKINKYTGADGLLANKGQRGLAISPDGTVYAYGGVFSHSGLRILKPNTQRWTGINLSVGYVTEIVFDKLGYCWVNGNGIYKVSMGGTKIDDSFCNQIAFDNNNNGWFGIAGSYPTGHVLKIDLFNNKTVYNNSNSLFPNNVVTDIIVDQQNNVWFATQDSGIICYTQSEWKRYTKDNSNLLTNTVQKLGISLNKDVIAFIASGNKCAHPLIYKFDGQNFNELKNTPFTAKNEYVSATTWDKNGILYISSTPDTFATVDTKPRVISYNGTNFNEILINGVNEIPYSATDNICSDSKGNIWIASYLGGVSKYDGKTWSHWDFRTDDLPFANFFGAIAVDSRDVVWVSSGNVGVSSNCNGGGYDGGISYYNNGKWLSLTPSSETKKSYNTILIDSKDKKYFLSYNGDNAMYDNTNWTPIPSISYKAGIDSYDTIWFVRNDTLFKYDGNNFTPYKIPENRGISSNVVVNDINGVWFTLGGYYPDTMVVANFKNNKWRLYRNQFFNDNPNGNLWGYAKISVDSSSTVWIGSNGGGLIKLITKTTNPNGSYQIFTPSNSDIGVAFISDVIIDRNNNKWITNSNYEGTIVQFNEDGIINSVYDDKVKEHSKAFLLSQNYPNPFNPETKISFTLSHKAFVELKVYDLLGREIITLFKVELDEGVYQKTFNAATLPAGVYFYRLVSGSSSEARKMLVIK